MKPSSIHNLELLNSYKDPIVDIKETAKKARELFGLSDQTRTLKDRSRSLFKTWKSI